jgi:hypothetical protein
MVPELTAHIVWILAFAKATRSASLPSQSLVINPRRLRSSYGDPTLRHPRLIFLGSPNGPNHRIFLR